LNNILTLTPKGPRQFSYQKPLKTVTSIAYRKKIVKNDFLAYLTVGSYTRLVRECMEEILEILTM